MWCPGRLFDYINTLGIPNFDVHIDQDLETEGAHFSTNAIYAGGVRLIIFGAIHFVALDFFFPTYESLAFPLESNVFSEDEGSCQQVGAADLFAL